MSEPIPDPTPDPTPAPEPELSEPGFAIDPQEWQQTQQQLQQLAEIVQPQPQWQPQQPQAPQPPDPFADNYQEQFQTYIDHVTAPMRQWQEQQQLTAAQQQAFSTLDNLAETGGDFDRTGAWARANQLILENGGDPMKALEQAAQQQRQFEKEYGDRAVEAFKQQLQGNTGSPGGPMPVGANGTQTVATGGLGNHPLAVTAKLFGPQVGG